MPRALKLAERAGVQVSPIGADYRTGKGTFMVKDLMPDIGELERLQLIIKEWIGMRMGR
jgi:hypothetical protein